jgi:hypothetical protein
MSLFCLKDGHMCNLRTSAHPIRKNITFGVHSVKHILIIQTNKYTLLVAIFSDILNGLCPGN